MGRGTARPETGTRTSRSWEKCLHHSATCHLCVLAGSWHMPPLCSDQKLISACQLCVDCHGDLWRNTQNCFRACLLKSPLPLSQPLLLCHYRPHRSEYTNCWNWNAFTRTGQKQTSAFRLNCLFRMTDKETNKNNKNKKHLLLFHRDEAKRQSYFVSNTGVQGVFSDKILDYTFLFRSHLAVHWTRLVPLSAVILNGSNIS